MKSYNQYLENYHKKFLTEEELLDEGFKEFIKELFERGKTLAKDAVNKFKSISSKLKNKLDKIKDSTEIIAIKALNSVEKVRDFIKRHPQLIWLVLAAMVAGFLVFPSLAHGAVASEDQIKDLSYSMNNFMSLTGEPSQASLHINPIEKSFQKFFLDIFDISIKGNLDTSKIIDDLYTNFGKAFNEFLKNNNTYKQIHIADPEKALDIYNFAYKNITNALVDKVLKVVH